MSTGKASIAQRIGGLGLLLAAVAPVFAGEVRGISVDTGATGTRAEIQLAGAGEYKLIPLSGPARLVVDLPDAKARAGLKLPAAAGVVAAVRTGQPVPGTLRIVFDLSSPVAALKPHLEGGGQDARLVIEWPGDGPAVAAAPAPAPADTSASSPPDPAAAARATAALAGEVA
ncbi:MAG: AMIN domain-containing protein, partial [Pseudoxanthomonas sp.]